MRTIESVTILTAWYRIFSVTQREAQQRGVVGKCEPVQTNADKRSQTQANAEAKTQANASKREQMWTNANKRLPPPYCGFYTPLCNPLKSESGNPEKLAEVLERVLKKRGGAGRSAGKGVGFPIKVPLPAIRPAPPFLPAPSPLPDLTPIRFCTRPSGS